MLCIKSYSFEILDIMKNCEILLNLNKLIQSCLHINLFLMKKLVLFSIFIKRELAQVIGTLKNLHLSTLKYGNYRNLSTNETDILLTSFRIWLGIT